LLLRILLAFLLGWALLRVVRRVTASLSPPRKRPPGRSLDPERAVQAKWTEVDEEGADG
jgi:hypothetical protein